MTDKTMGNDVRLATAVVLGWFGFLPIMLIGTLLPFHWVISGYWLIFALIIGIIATRIGWNKAFEINEWLDGETEKEVAQCNSRYPRHFDFTSETHITEYFIRSKKPADE